MPQLYFLKNWLLEMEKEKGQIMTEIMSLILYDETNDRNI